MSNVFQFPTTPRKNFSRNRLVTQIANAIYHRRKSHVLTTKECAEELRLSTKSVRGISPKLLPYSAIGGSRGNTYLTCDVACYIVYANKLIEDSEDVLQPRVSEGGN